MTVLLCPDCLRWQEAEPSCAACGGLLDLFVYDPPIVMLSQRIGVWHECLGEVDVVRSMWPQRGWLHVTANGMLVVPQSSVVMNPILAERHAKTSEVSKTSEVCRVATSIPMWLIGWLRHRLFGAIAADRQSGIESLPSPQFVAGMSPEQLAELLLYDPGVFFVSRDQIVTWRPRWRSWELLRPDARWWPERLIPRDRDVQKRMLNWLETTACPQPTINP